LFQFTVDAGCFRTFSLFVFLLEWHDASTVVTVPRKASYWIPVCTGMTSGLNHCVY
jgi:hypothetical protein